MKDFKSYLKEYSAVGNVVSTDYKQALVQLAVKPGSKEWDQLLFMLDGDEKLAHAVIEKAAAEAEANFLKILGVGFSDNAINTPAKSQSEHAWVGDKGETVGIIGGNS